MRLDLDSLEKQLQELFEQRLTFNRKSISINQITHRILSESINLLANNESNEVQLAINLDAKLKDFFNEESLSNWIDLIIGYIQEKMTDKNRFQILSINVEFCEEIDESRQFSIDISPANLEKTERMKLRESDDKKIVGLLGYLIKSDDTIFEIKNNIVNIGRSEDNDLVLENLRVSRSHAQIRQIENTHVVFDLDSTVGTFVNGNRVSQTKLNHGDVIEIADTAMVYFKVLDDQNNPISGETKILNQ